MKMITRNELLASLMTCFDSLVAFRFLRVSVSTVLLCWV